MLEEKDSIEYISLQEATKYCHYTQEYLSLRARQGKLKAKKFGRNWVTKRVWLEEYLETAEDYKIQTNLKKFIAPTGPSIKELSVLTLAVSPSPSRLRFAFVTVLLFTLLVGGIIFSKIGLRNSFEILNYNVEELNQSFDKLVFTETINHLKHFINDLPENIAETKELTRSLTAMTFRDFLDYNFETFKEYSQWVSQQVFAILKILAKVLEVWLIL